MDRIEGAENGRCETGSLLQEGRADVDDQARASGPPSVARRCVHACYAALVERIGIRELRIHTSRAVRRAMSGERIVITVNGAPVAQLGPLNAGSGAASVDDLVAAGLLRRPRSASPPPAPAPVAAPTPGTTSTEVLREHRSR